MVFSALGLVAGCATNLPDPDRASLRVEGERVTIAAPPGLCMDPQSLDVRREGGFLLISDCALFQDTPARPVDFNGVIAVSVSTGGLPEDLDELASFLAGPGRAVLGRSGQADQIEVLETRVREDAVFLKVRDAGTPVIPGTQPVSWRVFFPAGPRLATASLIAFDGASEDDDAAVGWLTRLMQATRAANAGQAAAASPVTSDGAAG